MGIIRKILCAALLGLLFLLPVAGLSHASQDTSASAITNSQDMIAKEEALRKKLDKNEKVYLKKAVTTGITLIDNEEIRHIISPFKNHWISRNDIRIILDSIRAAYKEKGFYDKIESISYRVNKTALYITVKEK